MRIFAADDFEFLDKGRWTCDTKKVTAWNSNLC